MAQEESAQSFVNYKGATEEGVGREIALSMLKGPPCRGVLEVWRSLKGERPMPRRKELAPRLIAPYLRSVTLNEIGPDAENFKNRVAGDAVIEMFGTSYAGVDRVQLNKTHPGMGELLNQLYKAVLHRRGPIAVQGWITRGDGDPVFQETLFLPLSSEEGSIDHILTVSTFGLDLPPSPKSKQ